MLALWWCTLYSTLLYSYDGSVTLGTDGPAMLSLNLMLTCAEHVGMWISCRGDEGRGMVVMMFEMKRLSKRGNGNVGRRSDDECLERAGEEVVLCRLFAARNRVVDIHRLRRGKGVRHCLLSSATFHAI